MSLAEYEGRGMAVTRPCAPAGLCGSARSSPVFSDTSVRPSFLRTTAVKKPRTEWAARQLPSSWWRWSRPVCCEASQAPEPALSPSGRGPNSHAERRLEIASIRGMPPSALGCSAEQITSQ